VVERYFLWISVIHFDVSELCFKAKAPQNNSRGAFVLLKSLRHDQSTWQGKGKN